MNAAATDKPRRVSRLRRVLLILLATSPLWVCLLIGLAVHLAATSRLRRAIADADARDPGWRLADLERGRANPRKEENSALVVLTAADALDGVGLGEDKNKR